MAVTPLCDGECMSDHTFDTASIPWSSDARCDSADPELFFPRDGTDNTLAKSICQTCPVRRQCLDYALETRQKYGIWGGMTEAQRRRLRRDGRANHPANPRPLVEHAIAATDAEVAVEPMSVARRHLTLVR